MAGRPAPGDADERARTIGRNATFSLIAQLTGAIFTAGLTVFLARRLGTGGFGVYSLALGIGGLGLLPSDFGISTAVARFVAEHRGDHAGVTRVVADGLKLKLIVSAAVSGLLFALSEPLASAYGTHALTWPIRGVAIALFGQSLMMLSSVFVAMRRVDVQLRTALCESSVEVTATIALVLAGAGVTGAAFGRAAGYLIAAALTLALIVRMIGPDVLPRSARMGEHTRRIATYAGVILITDGAFTLFNQVDVLIIGAYLGAGAVGFFSGPLRLIAFLGYPGGAIATGVSPLLARGPLQEPDKPAFLSALRLVLILQGAFTAFVLGWSDLIVRVTLGSHYTKSVDVLRALAPFVFMLGFGPLVSAAVNYLGEARRRVPVAIATAIVNLVVDLLLVPRIGVVGGSVGTDVAYGIYAPAHLYICQRALALDLRAPARTLVRTLAATGASAGVLLACGDSLSEPWWIALGGVAAVATYGGVLWLTRELTPREAVGLLRQLRGMRRAQPAGADS